MIARSYAPCPDITILNGATNSNTVLASNVFADCEAFSLFASAIDAAKTYKIQLSNDEGVTWYDWNDGAASIIPPSVIGTASTYGNPVSSAMRIVANAVVVGAVTWKMNKSYVA